MPGVLDIKVFPNYYGIGTVGIFVFGAAKRSNIHLVEEVERKLSLTKPPGITYYVTQGIAVYVDLEITVYVNTKLESEKKTGLIGKINSNIRGYMSNLNGNILNLVDLRDVILNSNPEIIGMTDPEDRLSVFDGVYIRKAYGEGSLTSERIKFETSSINILSSEFFTLGTLEIKFEENF